MNNQSNTAETAGRSTRLIMKWILIALVVVGAIYGMIKIVSKGLNPVNQQKQTAQVDIMSSFTGTEKIKGNPQAKVVVIEYSDFECPACAAYHTLFGDMVTSYGDKIQFAYRYFPLGQHPVAKLSASVAEAAHRQGKFWEMHNMLFDHQADWAGKPDKAKEIFLGYAKVLKLDIAKFNKDISSAETAAIIEASYQSGIKYGVDRTPSLYVNNTRVYDLNLLKKIIDDEIAKNK